MPSLRHEFQPAWLMRAFTILFDIAAIAMPLYVFVAPLYSAVTSSTPNTIDLRVVAGLFVAAAFFSISILIAAHFHSDVISDQAGLHVRFLWFRLLVRWTDIVDVKPMFRLPFDRNHRVVQTRSLTPFHRLYGIIYSFSFAPSLIISRDMTHGQELIHRINLSLKQNQQQGSKNGPGD